MFFDDWFGLLRVLVVGTLAYAALVVMLRVSGKRTLSKMNAFDFIVTVALGSTLANLLLSQDVVLLEGLLGFALLIGLQAGVAWLSVRSETWQGLIKSEPRLLALRGEFSKDAMRAERITEEEVNAALRSQGFASLQVVYAVVLETDGTVSVVQDAAPEQAAAAMITVNGFPRNG